MQRLESTGPLGQGPELKPLEQNKYWATGGWNQTDLREQLDADAIDLVKVIESSKPWEQLKLPIVCKICEKTKANQPYLDQVHWCFQHCTQCEDFYICIDCYPTEEFDKLKGDHKDHKFVQITTRPLSAPLYDGSDLDHLQLFRNSKTSQQFFSYFPWFFHCFVGFQEVREFNRNQTIAALQTSPDIGSQEWLCLMEMQSYPVDWYTRTFGRGEWELLLENMKPLLDARVESARASIQLHGLLGQLKKFNDEKVALYGAGDIPCLREAGSWRPVAASLATNMVDYITYTIPLQFMTVLDTEIDHTKVDRLLDGTTRNRSDSSGREVSISTGTGIEDRIQNLHIEAGERDDAGSQNHINDGVSLDIHKLQPDTTTDPYREMLRLWPMFSVIFKAHPGYDELISPVMMSDLSSHFEKMKPSWHSFLSRDHLIRERLWQTDYKNLPEMTIKNLSVLVSATMNPWPPTHLNAESLLEAQKRRMRGNYEEAIAILRPFHDVDPTDVHIALELQQVYLQQGYFQKAMACGNGVAKAELVALKSRMDEASQDMEAGDMTSATRTSREVRVSSPIARALLRMISNYLRCFVHGKWEVAVAEAAEMFDKYLVDWNPGAEDPTLLIYLALYYHKIILATCRDLEHSTPRDAGLARLRAIRHHLCNKHHSSGLAPLAWEVLLTELEMLKRTIRDQYFDMEDAFSVAKYVHTESIARPMISDFERSDIMTEARTHNTDIWAAMTLLNADIFSENGAPQVALLMLRFVEAEYHNLSESSGLPPHAGLFDVQLLDIKLAGRSIAFGRIQSLYDDLRQRNDLTRLRQLRRCNVTYLSKDSPAHNWELFQRSSLRELAKEAGDNIMYQRWNLRKYAGDTLSVASINDAERVIANDDSVAVHSSFLVVFASFNLSRAYLSVGNFFEAALNSLLHLSLTAQRGDVESHQRAMLNVLHIYSEAAANNTTNPEETLQILSVLWPGWLTPKSYDRWEAGQARCDEIDRFIDAALFIPNLAGRVGRENQGASKMIPKPYNSNFIDYMITHLRLAFALYEALPKYLAHTVIPKLALGLAAVATYVCNKELAIRTYAIGQTAIHSQDFLSLATFRLRAGKLMTLLGEEDPEHWMHVVPAGRALLKSAAEKFLSIRQLAGAQMRICEANVDLLRSVVAEGRARKLLLTERWESLGGGVDDLDRYVYGQIVTVINLQEEALMPMTMTDILILKTAQRLVMASPYEASQNLAYLASSPIPRKNRELVIELCYILSDLEPFQGKPTGSALCTFIQRYKANILYRQSFSNLVPSRYLEAIEADPTALKLYQEEQRLIKEGPQAMGDNRLQDLEGEMLEHPTLKPLLDHRHNTLKVVPSDFHSLASVSKLTQGPDSDLILIDWMKYHDYFLITGYNVTKQKICILELIPDCEVIEVEEWVTIHLKVDGKLLPKTLDSSDIFKPLYPLVRAIAGSCTKEDLLVFSPSQELHSIPLHALPYANEDDRPIIDFHPIVYTPSNLILKQCIVRVLESSTSPPSTASLFGRWGSESTNAEEEERNISTSLENISTQLSTANIKSTIISGSSLTHKAFSSNMSQSDILHFHTHVNETGLKQHLQLEPEASSSTPSSPSIPRSLNPFVHLHQTHQNNTYNLQDAFATQIRAKLVVMMGCRSGQQHISSSEDALGLISAFFAAGASSIVATLWQFETADASKFSSFFYKEMFAEEAGGGDAGKRLIDVAGAFRTSVVEMRACQKNMCKKKRSLEERLGCHVGEEQGEPYHWASFVLWGSWVMRGVGSGEEDGEGGGDVFEGVREEVLGGGSGDIGNGSGKGKEREVRAEAEVDNSAEDSYDRCSVQ
ncbi:hypothetical protein ONS96_013235 [Cadophora gregata f. sp. sojae]|nr:hypothetical protein ONS96_013235 [Cadophora gregata f. sp. sojae]